MVVKVLYFGRLKELCGSAEECVDVSEGATIKDLFSQCSAKVPAMRDYRSSVVASRNQEFASWDTVLSVGDEIGFLPPVSGG
jgi:molybdopterin converting factor subunit 1